VRVRHIETVRAAVSRDGSGLFELQGHLNLEVAIVSADEGMTLEDDVRIKIAYADSVRELPLRIYVQSRSELAADRSAILFSATHPAGLAGQSKRIRVCTNDDPTSLRLDGCPLWLRYSFSRGPIGEVMLDLTCAAIPDRIGDPIEVRLSATRGPQAF